ncbi:hypothetical protein NEUTE2DRAFT_66289 [Neurospora tetrasperma FGSC 2509]|nr:hypothetical protein NEUTE2DRAFT_66289 [Neurospora tetrasperma FGSC 2509]
MSPGPTRTWTNQRYGVSHMSPHKGRTDGVVVTQRSDAGRLHQPPTFPTIATLLMQFQIASILPCHASMRCHVAPNNCFFVVQDRKFISTFQRRTCQRTRTTNRIDIKIPGWPSLAWNQHAYPTQSEAEAPPNFGPIRTPLDNGWTTANGGGISLDICRSIWSIAVPVPRPEDFYRFSSKHVNDGPEF